MKRKNILLALSLLIPSFLAVEAIAASLIYVPGDYARIASEAIRIFIVAGVIGTMVPVVLGRKIELPYDRAVTSRRIIEGIVFMMAAIIVEILYYSSWFEILSTNPGDLVRIKHLLVTLPISIAISLVFFFLLPETVELAMGRGPASRIIALVVPAASLGLVLYAETGFTRPSVFYIMSAVGLLAAAGHLLTDKFFITFVTIFLAVYANSLSELRYSGYSWPVAITGFVFCIAILVAGFYVRLGDTGSPAPHESAPA